MPGSFSGNGSVTWTVEGNNVREAESTLLRPEKDQPRRVRQHGIDETDPDQYFTVAVKVPRNEDEAREFIDELREKVKGLKLGSTLEFRLPIEDIRRKGLKTATENQIVIAWPSSTRTRS